MPYYISYPYGPEEFIQNTDQYDLKRNKELDDRREENASLKLEGSSSIKVKPDIFTVKVGVVTEGKELIKVQEENKNKVEKVIYSIMNLGIPERNIKTSNYSIDPQYDYIEGKQTFRGYRVANILSITVDDINQAGKIIDTAVANGANVVYDIDFSLSNSSKYYNQVLSMAIENAIKKAKSIERSLGIKVDTIPSDITELSSEDMPAETRVLSLKSASTSTPIMSGEFEIRAKVKAVFRYIKF